MGKLLPINGMGAIILTNHILGMALLFKRFDLRRLSFVNKTARNCNKRPRFITCLSGLAGVLNRKKMKKKKKGIKNL